MPDGDGETTQETTGSVGTPAAGMNGRSPDGQVAGEALRTPWRALLRDRLRTSAVPLLVMPRGLTTAASTWAGARLWMLALREAGLVPGDRIVCALPPGAGFLALLVACLWDGYAFAPVPAGEPLPPLLATLDARLAVTTPEHDGAGDAPGHAHVARTAEAGQPALPLPALRATHGAPTPEVRLLLRTGGTTGTGRWIALSDANVLAVLRSHVPHMALEGARVLSVLPWHHAFGLVLGVLASLLHADELIRDPAGGRDLAGLLALADEYEPTHLDLVPALAERLARDERGSALLDRLRGGIVGGAPVQAPLAARLARTRLRVGYGQTEAAPGICFGEAGEWRPRWLGRALGCAVRRDDDGVLAFRGPNACLGEWRDGALVRLDADTWRRTGDVVRATDDGGWTFEGRASDSFKLANGRMVEAAHWEAALRTAAPAIDELVLHSPDGDTLAIVCSLRHDGIAPDRATLAAALGPLGDRLGELRIVAADAWTRTLKGEVDRRRLPPPARGVLAP
jgi:acyl-CoA synthetase (AMP-forming)/AMP-acid ligase II